MPGELPPEIQAKINQYLDPETAEIRAKRDILERRAREGQLVVRACESYDIREEARQAVAKHPETQ